ncbi:MAG: PRC-barrel domain-containing protein [Propionicimonas sp.]
MLYTQVTGRKVVSTSTAETVAQVAALVVDPRSHRVVAVSVKKADHGDTLLWNDITAFGTDAVTITGPEVIREANDAVKDLSGKVHDLLGKRVLNTFGEDLGTLSDVRFDPASGAVEALLLPGRDVSGAQLIGIGSYAVIVHGD